MTITKNEASIPKNSMELAQIKSPKKDNYHAKIFSCEIQ